MTTTTTKGRITGMLALTMATDLALAVGDFVQMVGDYKVGLCDGTKPCVGTVSVRSVKRVSDVNSTTFPVATTTGGQVTVEARGLSVLTRNAGAAFAAGVKVGLNNVGAIVAYADGSATVAYLGISLTASTGAGVEVDILTTAA